MESLPGIWSLSLPGALIGLVVLLAVSVIRGWFIPRSSHERELAQSDKRGDEWKETVMAERAVNQEIRKQNTMLIESGRTARKFFAETSIDIEDTGEYHVGP